MTYNPKDNSGWWHAAGLTQGVGVGLLVSYFTQPTLDGMWVAAVLFAVAGFFIGISIE